MDIRDTDPPEWAGWYGSLRAPCPAFQKEGPLADGQDMSKRTVAGADINQLR